MFGDSYLKANRKMAVTMPDDPSDDEIRRVRDYLERQMGAASSSASRSKGGFFSWLRNVGLTYLVDKFFDWSWKAIKAIFGWY